MSAWTYIHGAIKVYPMGRTQAEKTYVLQTILDHLPKVTGSEENMNVYVNVLNGTTSSSNHDEFGNRSNLLPSKFNDGFGSFYQQDEYMLTVEGSLRDRDFDTTYREFINWLCRLSKRCLAEHILVEIRNDWAKSSIINEHGYESSFYRMFESPAWGRANKDGKPAWAEYLMWQEAEDSDYPAVLAYKYFDDEKNNKRVRNWIGIEERSI